MLMLGVIALLVGGFLAVILMVPFIALSYRRHGRLSFWRAVGWLALLIYFFAIWTYTLLPLPETDTYRASGTQLIPLESVRDIRNYAHGSVGQLLRNEAVQQVALNVLLFMPLGFLIRTLFRRGFIIATLSGFALSLLVELTQLTAVWGLFPRPYRVFDVDDLLANTLGALLGSLVAFLFVGFARREEDTRSEPRRVTAGRRFLGMLCDFMFVSLLGFLLVIGWRLYRGLVLGMSVEAINDGTEWIFGLAIPLGIQLLWVLLRGTTVGESAVLLAPRYGRVPIALARPLRFIFGIGGYTVLTALDTPVTALIVPLFVLASIIAVWATTDRRGLACALSGSTVVDARLGAGEPVPTR